MRMASVTVATGAASATKISQPVHVRQVHVHDHAGRAALAQIPEEAGRVGIALAVQPRGREVRQDLGAKSLIRIDDMDLRSRELGRGGCKGSDHVCFSTRFAIYHARRRPACHPSPYRIAVLL
jgi:hypothetical protein